MNEFKRAKEEYESTPIPAELEARVRAGIRQGKGNRVRRVWSRRLGTVAACFVVMFGVLNLSPTVAAAAADIPVLGGLFQVLTVRSFTDVNPDRTLEVEQPASDFLLRLDKEGRPALYEADGGAWKLEAKRNIAAYLGEQLADLVESGNVVVMI